MLHIAGGLLHATVYAGTANSTWRKTEPLAIGLGARAHSDESNTIMRSRLSRVECYMNMPSLSESN